MPAHIKAHSIRHEFNRIGTLDEGDGNGNGALNGGIYIVKSALPPSNLSHVAPLTCPLSTGRKDKMICVEKRFHHDDVLRIGLPEMRQLRQFDHANVCKYIDAFVKQGKRRTDADQGSLYMELCDLGSVGDMIERLTDKAGSQTHLPEAFVWHMLNSLMQGLTYIHQGTPKGTYEAISDWQTVLHCDIKPHNIFLKTPRQGGLYPTIVIGDFGVCQKQSDPHWDRARRIRGTIAWQPPELPLHAMDGKGDVYSAAAVVLCLVRLESPLRKCPRHVKIRDWERLPEARYPRYLGSRYSKILNGVHAQGMSTSYEQRPTALQLLKHLMKQFDEVELEFHKLPLWVLGKE